MTLSTIAFLPISLAVAQAGAAQPQPLSFEGTLQPCANSHSVRLEAGQRYAITAASDAFDTIVRVYRAGSAEPLAQDDDGGDGTNSRAAFAPAESGDYLVCVTAYNSGGSGAYRVGIEELAPLPPLTPTRPTRTARATWQIWEGALDEGDQDEGGNRFDDYEISLRPGERAYIALDSGAFDPRVAVYAADARSGEPIASDDDGGGALNSFVAFAPEAGGRFIVRATSFSAGSGGAYRLSVVRHPMPAPARVDGGGGD